MDHRAALPARLVVIDLDGTLIDDREVLDPQTAALLQRASQVATLAIATGRPLADALRWAATSHYVVPLNGAAVVNVRDHEPLWQAPGLRPALLALLAQLGRAYGVTVHYHALDGWYIERPDATTEPYARRHGLTPLFADWRSIRRPLLQAELLGASGPLAAIRSALPPDCIATQARDLSGHYLDISPPAVDKARAVAHLLTRLGHDWRAVLAIGNGENDIPLFARAATSVAVADSHRALLCVATHRLTLPAGGKAVQTALRALLWQDHAALPYLLTAPTRRRR